MLMYSVADHSATCCKGSPKCNIFKNECSKKYFGPELVIFEGRDLGEFTVKAHQTCSSSSSLNTQTLSCLLDEVDSP